MVNLERVKIGITATAVAAVGEGPYWIASFHPVCRLRITQEIPAFFPSHVQRGVSTPLLRPISWGQSLRLSHVVELWAQLIQPKHFARLGIELEKMESNAAAWASQKKYLIIERDRLRKSKERLAWHINYQQREQHMVAQLRSPFDTKATRAFIKNLQKLRANADRELKLSREKVRAHVNHRKRQRTS